MSAAGRVSRGLQHALHACSGALAERAAPDAKALSKVGSLRAAGGTTDAPPCRSQLVTDYNMQHTPVFLHKTM